MLPRFAPNINVTIFEEGDLNHGQTCSHKKPINWFTDQYGFRNENNIKNSEYIFVGCSNVLGSNCNYLKTFSGLMNENYKIFNVAPDYNLNFFHRIYCEEKPKKIKHIFLVQVARYFTHENQFKYSKVPYDNTINQNNLIIERVKGNYFGNKIKSIITSASKQNSQCKESFHYYGSSPETEFISNNIKTLKKRLSFFKIPTTVIVIPDKEFYRPNDTVNRCVYFNIIKKLHAVQLSTINISSSFNEQCYFHGDGHINEKGHQIIAKFINEVITSSKLNQTHQGSN
jgi:hypothetical protein